MDVAEFIQQKLTDLGLDQRDLADAAEVTESYISQLLSRRKTPPAPERTDIYDKLGRFLKLPSGKLAGLADLQRLSGDATPEEVEFLRQLRFKNGRPTALYYYRELQNLRDPLHFRRK